MHVPEQLIHQVLALSPEGQAELLALLQENLALAEPPGEPASDEELAAAWTAEIDRRIDEMETGKSIPIDAETALADLRRQLEERENQTGKDLLLNEP
jgi:hypothetical protein